MSDQLSQRAQQLSTLYDNIGAVGGATKATVAFYNDTGRKAVEFTVDTTELDRLKTLVRASLKADIADLRAQIDDLDKSPKGRKP